MRTTWSPGSEEMGRLTDILTPFLVTRQMICGAGKILHLPRGAVYCVSQRAEHIWEVASSATTRSRPIINTRDEPHADAERFRRLHVIVGDSNMSETSMLLKVGSTDLVLRMIEARTALPDMTLDNPIRAIREISHDLTGRSRVRLANGREMSALEIQYEYLTRAREFTSKNGLNAISEQVLERWERALEAIETGNLDKIAREIDWVTKYQLIERYRARYDLPLSAPGSPSWTWPTTTCAAAGACTTCCSVDGAMDRVTRDLDIFEAKSTPPQTTRAKLRGEFIRRALENRRDFTVDWMHLKLNDQAQRTVLCKDPFRSVDERVERLIASM